MPTQSTSAGPREGSWTFLSNHAHVLVCLAKNPDTRLREVAESVGITERAVFKIVGELEAAGVISRTREGRRNHYDINRNVTLRHPLESDRTVGGLLAMLLGEPEGRSTPKKRPRRSRAG